MFAAFMYIYKSYILRFLAAYVKLSNSDQLMCSPNNQIIKLMITQMSGYVTFLKTLTTESFSHNHFSHIIFVGPRQLVPKKKRQETICTALNHISLSAGNFSTLNSLSFREWLGPLVFFIFFIFWLLFLLPTIVIRAAHKMFCFPLWPLQREFVAPFSFRFFVFDKQFMQNKSTRCRRNEMCIGASSGHIQRAVPKSEIRGRGGGHIVIANRGLRAASRLVNKLHIFGFEIADNATVLRQRRVVGSRHCQSIFTVYLVIIVTSFMCR